MIRSSGLKPVIERMLLHGGPARVSSRFRKRNLLILAYHNIVPDDAAPTGDKPLHLPLDAFRRQLDVIAENYDVVDLDTVDLAATPHPRIAITFDDVYRGALEYGGPELARRNLPATMFAAPAFLGGGAFWWDRLGMDATDSLAPRLREFILSRLAGSDARTRAWAEADGRSWPEVPSLLRCPGEEELLSMAQAFNLTFGSHSWSHANLTALSGAELRVELRKSLDWVRALPSGLQSAWLSYPYGLFDIRVQEVARELGYAGALAIRGGWVPRDVDPFGVPRLNVPAGISIEGFKLRLAGLLTR